LFLGMILFFFVGFGIILGGILALKAVLLGSGYVPPMSF
jgi:hypothetical protein